MKSIFHPGRRRSNSVQYDSGVSGVSATGTNGSGSGRSSLGSANSGDLDMVHEEMNSSSVPKSIFGRQSSVDGPKRPGRMRSASLSVAGPDWGDSSAAILVQTRNLPVDYRSTAVPLLKSFSLPSSEQTDSPAPKNLASMTDSEKELNLFMVEEPEQGLGRLLQAYTCYEVVPNNAKVVALDVKLPVKKALSAFLNNRLRAALLWQANGPQDPGRIVGLLGITDFIRVLLKTHDETYSRLELRVGVEMGAGEVVGLVTPPSSLPKESPISVQVDSVERRLEEQEIGSWRRMLEEEGTLEPLLTITSHESLFRAAQLLSQRRLNRLPVLDPLTHDPLHILTLKAILRFAWKRGARLTPHHALARTPKELGLGVWGMSVRTVLPTTPLIDCLRLLMEKRISGLPVLSPEGKVVDIFTRFDAIGIAADGTFDRLSETSVEDALHRRSANAATFEGLVHCGVEERLDAVVEKMVEKDVHRVLIVGPSHELRGLVAISDVVQLLVLSPMTASQPLSLQLPPTFSLPDSASSLPASLPSLPSQPSEEMEWAAGIADEMEIIHEEPN